ncbi:MAG: peroxidase [Candidatus Delongbacteria bacterium]|nr:peroxidase [Candidatus Delongbacteria bacterium]
MSDDKAEEFIHELRDHRNSSILSEADKVMLDYTVILTVKPSEIKEKIIQELRDNGFDDRGIHDICTIVAYFNFVNRIATGLGVELEKKGENYD